MLETRTQPITLGSDAATKVRRIIIIIRRTWFLQTMTAALYAVIALKICCY